MRESWKYPIFPNITITQAVLNLIYHREIKLSGLQRIVVAQLSVYEI